LVNGKDENEDAISELGLEPATDEEHVSEDDFESDLDEENSSKDNLESDLNDEDEYEDEHGHKDEDEDQTSTNTPPVAGSRIERALRFTIVKLKDAANAMNPQDPNPPMLPKFMWDLRQISVDGFVRLFLPGFSRHLTSPYPI
jgi:hypothetical protein